MIKENPRDNLMDLLAVIGLASVEQLAYLFRGEMGDRAFTMIENELRFHNLFEDASGLYVQPRLGPRYKKEEAMKFVKAFWVIAEFGSESLKYISRAQPPSQFVFISTDNALYDITVIDNLAVAEMASRTWKTVYVDPSEKENAIHLAVTNNESLIPKLRKLGFNFFYDVRDIEYGDVVRLEEKD